jgi:hypothetical protein
MNEPRILLGDSVGMNNSKLEESIQRVEKSNMYKDNSTIIICPTRGMFPTRVVQSWMKLMKPMNQNVAGPIFAESMKVDVAYETLVEYILNNEYLSKYKYILSIEEDNLPPSDGLLRLYEDMDNYDAVGGLYWGKGENGFPMIFGNPDEPNDFKPQTPIINTLQKANGIGMGFTLFKLDMFRNIEQPWFKTIGEINEDGISEANTQDLYFFKKAGKLGFKCAVDTRILVGHFDSKTDQIW